MRLRISSKYSSEKRTYLNLSSHLSNPKNTRTSYKLCSSTVVNFSDLKINSKCLSKKPNKEVSQCRKYCHLRRKSSMKRLKRWLMHTVGSCSQKNQSQTKQCLNAQASCNSNPKFLLTRRLTNFFMNQCCFSVLSV